MDAQKKSALLNALRDEFDDYIDYYDLMECLPDITETKIESLRSNRTRNGLSEISYYTKRKGKLLVSCEGFRRWVASNFKFKHPKEEEEDDD